MLIQNGVNHFLFTVFLLCTACSQAGILPDAPTNSVGAGQSQTDLIEVTGKVGIGEPITESAITAINVTALDNPQILAESESDASGSFVLTGLPLTANDDVMLIATGGRYTDPITYKSVQMKTDSLSGIWKVKNLSLLTSVDITPMTTLQTAFYQCLAGNSTLGTDPVEYSHAIFKTLFGTDLNSDMDSYLEGETNAETGSSALSLYNLAFAAMAEQTKASSAIHLISSFGASLEDDCDLLAPGNKTSGAYAFHSESFRKDYLDAFEGMQARQAFSELTDQFDVSERVESIRNSENILFEFTDYDL